MIDGGIDLILEPITVGVVEVQSGKERILTTIEDRTCYGLRWSPDGSRLLLNEASLTGNVAAVTVALVHLLFNLSGIAIFYPYRRLRRVPVQLAQLLAERTSNNRMFAVYYMLGIFFAMPLIFVLVSRAFGSDA